MRTAKGDEVKEDEEETCFTRVWIIAWIYNVVHEFIRTYTTFYRIYSNFTVRLEEVRWGYNEQRVLHSYQVSFTTSFAVAIVNAIFGLLIAWVLVRYKFPGKDY